MNPNSGSNNTKLSETSSFTNYAVMALTIPHHCCNVGVLQAIIPRPVITGALGSFLTDPSPPGHWVKHSPEFRRDIGWTIVSANYHIYLRLMIDGVLSQPSSGETLVQA